MAFWKYIGEFFMFRWLFDKFRKSETGRYAHTDGLRTSIDRECEYLTDYHDEDRASVDDPDSLVDDDVVNDSDNSEELDDLDIFMRNNNGNNQSYSHHGDYGGGYRSSSRYSSHNDWDYESCSQSFDDFHDEQDDYDMIDDDF